jgi:HEAT repeat protein
MLEDNLSRVTHQRRAEIIEQLESGPLNNRVVAASALGFTRDLEAQSPLIAALDDAYPEVVGNALLGLMLLGRSDTPLEPICRLMQSSPDESVRRNAAQCMGSLVQAGARSDCVLGAARQGLSDVEPGVRSQSALLLATLLDPESIPPLCDLLYDEVPLVVAAAARAVAYFGGQSPKDKGTAARALARAYEEGKGPMRPHYRRALVELAGIDYGVEPEKWTEWGNRLP